MATIKAQCDFHDNVTFGELMTFSMHTYVPLFSCFIWNIKVVDRILFLYIYEATH